MMGSRRRPIAIAPAVVVVTGQASGGGSPISSVDALRVFSTAIGIGSVSLECPPCR